MDKTPDTPGDLALTPQVQYLQAIVLAASGLEKTVPALFIPVPPASDR